MPSCDILLAAYNGEIYGPALLDSLLAQTWQDYRLIVRDDGSKDRTLEMIEAYRARFGGRIQLIQDGAPTGSAQGNFSILMAHSDADYVLCCDIDDVWRPSKVEETIKLMQSAPDKGLGERPLFVFTDATPVNSELQPVMDSYWAFKKIDPRVSQSLARLLICTPMLGCASGMNRALVRLATPVPIEATGHDWWALLIAAVLGDVMFSSDKTMLYRLHGANSSGPKEVNLVNYASDGSKVARVRRGLRRRADQASELLSKFGERMADRDREIVKRFAQIPEKDFLMRRLLWLTGGYFYPDVERNLATLVGM